MEILLDLWFGSENSKRFYVIYVTVTRSNHVSQDYFAFPRIRFWARHIRGWGQIMKRYMIKTARLTIIIMMIWIRLLYTITCWSLIFLLIICNTKKTFNRLVLDRVLKFLFIVRASFPRNEGQTPQIRLRFPQAVLSYPPKRKTFSLDDLFVHKWTLCLFNNKDSACRGAVCFPRKNCRPRTKQPTDLSLLKSNEFFHFAWPTIWKLRWAMQELEEVLAKLQQKNTQLISSADVFAIEATNNRRVIRVLAKLPDHGHSCLFELLLIALSGYRVILHDSSTTELD